MQIKKNKKLKDFNAWPFVLLRPQLFPLFYCINTVDHYEKMSHFGIHSSVQSKYLRSGSIFIIFFFLFFFYFTIRLSLFRQLFTIWCGFSGLRTAMNKIPPTSESFSAFRFPVFQRFSLVQVKKRCQTLLCERTGCLQTWSTKLCSWFIRCSMNSSL